jgi:hypothetical protein
MDRCAWYDSLNLSRQIQFGTECCFSNSIRSQGNEQAVNLYCVKSPDPRLSTCGPFSLQRGMTLTGIFYDDEPGTFQLRVMH